MPAPVPQNMDGETVDLNPPPPAPLSRWDGWWSALFGALVRGLSPDGDRIVP